MCMYIVNHVARFYNVQKLHAIWNKCVKRLNNCSMIYLASWYPIVFACTIGTSKWYQFAAYYDELITKSWPTQRWEVKYYRLSDLPHSVNISNDINTKLLVPFLTLILRHLRKFEQNLFCSLWDIDVLVTSCYNISGIETTNVQTFLEHWVCHRIANNKCQKKGNCMLFRMTAFHFQHLYFWRWNLPKQLLFGERHNKSNIWSIVVGTFLKVVGPGSWPILEANFEFQGECEPNPAF